MKATLRRSREEALLEHLRGMGVEADLVQYDVGSESGTKREMVKLIAQDIDGIWVEDRSTYSEYVRSSLYYFHYLLLSRLGYKLAELAKEIEAKTKEVKKYQLWGKVRDVRWVGGPIVQSLNSDIELSQLLVRGEQPSVKISPNPWKYHIDIFSISGMLRSSRETFIAYNRIAKHIRNYLASQEGSRGY
jgi:hypothetical protein